MILKFIFISLVPIIVSATTCSYQLINNEYTCRLVNQSISRGEDMENVTGNHMENFGDINVQRLDHEFSVVQVFPSTLINRFVNLRVLYLHGTQMRFWDNRIENCRRLVEFEVNGNSYATIEPNYFAECDRLSVLSFNQNRIRTITDNAFAGLSGLDTLSLAGNIIRTITFTMLRPVANLSNLILDNNQIVELPYETLAAVPNLRVLSLRNNAITTWNVHILRFNQRLERLFLSGNELITLEPNVFSNLPNLVELWIGNLLENLPAFESVSSLETLVLDDNQLTNITSVPFTNMRSLKRLHLNRNRIGFFDFSVTSSRVLSTLEELQVNNNSIGWFEDCTFDALTGLKRLELSFNEFRRVPYDYLKPTLPLESLDIRRNMITEIDRRIIDESQDIYLMAAGNLCIDENFLVNSTFDMDNLQECFSAGGIVKFNIFVLISTVILGLSGAL